MQRAWFLSPISGSTIERITGLFSISLRFLREKEGLSVAEHLQGHDVGAMMLEWTKQRIKELAPSLRDPAQSVCFMIMELHKQKTNAWRDDPEREESIASMSIKNDSLQRRETSNRKLVPGGSNLIEDDGSQQRFLQRSEIDAVLKAHEGEARVWQTTTEYWEPLLDARILFAGEEGMGLEFPGTRVAETFAARGAEFESSAPGWCSRRRDVVDFS